MVSPIKRLIAVAALSLLAGIPANVARAEQNYQASQQSDSAAASSGTSNSNNSNGFQAGASASGTSASAQQNGDNSKSGTQKGAASTGDTVAGGSVAGLIGDDVTAQITNSAEDPDATSGNATTTNTTSRIAGAVAAAVTTTARVAQAGDNVVEFAQDGNAATGDAVGGSVVIGVVGDGEHTVQVTSDFDCAETCAFSGNLVARNEFNSGAGAEAVAPDAVSTQDGNNGVTLDQSLSGETGDAVAGGQVTGIVGGSATVQETLTADCDARCGFSGSAELLNTASPFSGTLAISGLIGAAPGGPATATQNGDNVLDASQNLAGATGDVVAGAQVLGAVGDGELVAQLNNDASFGTDSFLIASGPILATNQLPNVQVGAAAIAGLDDATATQNGDNDAVLQQAGDIATGDAVRGSQVTGATGYEDVLVQANNTADFAIALNSVPTGLKQSGLGNFIGASPFFHGCQLQIDGCQNPCETDPNAPGCNPCTLEVGGCENPCETDPNAPGCNPCTDEINACIQGALAPDQVIGLAPAMIVGTRASSASESTSTQAGDNAADIGQDYEFATGDVVAGSQVTGLVADNATAQLTNSSVGANAQSGNADVDVVLNGFVGTQASAPNGATATQDGDDSISFTQAAAATSGDAVAGSQVTGVVADSSTIQTSNDSVDSLGVSGLADALNTADGDVGVRVIAEGPVVATQSGDATAAADQVHDVAAGDAVSGSQITGKA